jgi:ABC-2 type transport system ATP-binding protein
MIEAVVSAHRLSKQIDDKSLLRDISLAVPQGSVVGVLGKNGAGKTTLLEILLGFSRASSGTASLFGHDSFTLPASIKRRIGFVPQQDELVGLLTGEQQLSLTASLSSRWNASLIDRLSIAWELPVSRLIQEIAAQETRTVLFSTHITSDLERVANEIWILREGTLAWHSELDCLKESVVRLNIRARGRLPAPLDIAGALSCRSDGVRATAAGRAAPRRHPGLI